MRTEFWVPAIAFALLMVGLLVGFALFDDTSPLGGVQIGIGADAITVRAGQVADSLGLDRTGLLPNTEMSRRKEILGAVFARYGLGKGNELLRTRVPGYFWRVNWDKPDDMNVVVSGEGSSRSESRQATGAPGDRLQMAFDLQGALIEFDAQVPDSIPLRSLTADSARLVADAFLACSVLRVRALSGMAFKEEKHYEIPRSGRTDYAYSWEGTDSLLGHPVVITMRIAGTRVVALNIREGVSAPSTGKGVSSTFEFGGVIFIVALGITMIVVAIRRIRVYEIGWRTGIVIGILGGVLFGLDLFFSLPRGLDLRAAVSLLIAPLFMGGFMVLSWAVAESVGREIWKEKFVPLDLLTRGHLLDSRVAAAVLVGFAGGAVARVVWSCMVWLLELMTAVSFNPEATQFFQFVGRPAPALSLLAHNAYSQVFILSALLLFPLAIARRRITSPWFLAALGSLFVVLTRKPAADPFALGLLIEWASMTVVVGVLCRKDLLAAFVALVTAPTLSVLPVFLKSTDPAVLLSGETVLLLFGIVVLVSWIGVLTKDRVSDLEAITPAFARHISERERLQQELRIARDVQMSLLPKTTPSVPGLDLAARCVPAQEVGGDYYDFVLLGEGRLGVVIGDVSGKGTEGAFYMTLTKGFLKAVVRVSLSPAVVLTQANALFYENVNRGNFVSMIYASLEMGGAKVTFARAGHNPVILFRARSLSADFFQPKGIALGLEPGEVFAKTIEEVSVPFEAGDVLVLYTDGFGEAMNMAREQFGEVRLRESVVRLAGGSSEEILSGILGDVGKFVGRAEQHDDMTMVVIKKT